MRIYINYRYICVYTYIYIYMYTCLRTDGRTRCVNNVYMLVFSSGVYIDIYVCATYVFMLLHVLRHVVNAHMCV